MVPVMAKPGTRSQAKRHPFRPICSGQQGNRVDQPHGEVLAANAVAHARQAEPGLPVPPAAPVDFLCYNQVKLKASRPRSGPIFDTPRHPAEPDPLCPTELAKTREIMPRALIYRHLHGSSSSNPPSRSGAGHLTGPPLVNPGKAPC